MRIADLVPTLPHHHFTLTAPSLDFPEGGPRYQPEVELPLHPSSHLVSPPLLHTVAQNKNQCFVSLRYRRSRVNGNTALSDKSIELEYRVRPSDLVYNINVKAKFLRV